MNWDGRISIPDNCHLPQKDTGSTTLNSAELETEARAETATNWPQCDGCGATVTKEYHRSLSDSRDVLRACLYCATQGADYGGDWR